MNIVPPPQQVSLAGANSESDREAARMRYRCRVASPHREMDLALVNRDAAKTRYFLVGALTTNHPSPHLPFSPG